MEALGPIIGMLLLGGMAGWFLGRLFRNVLRWALIGLAVIIGLELVGYRIATAHWDSIIHSASGVAATTGGFGPLVCKLARYNIPFTGGLIMGLWYAMTAVRRK